MEPSGVALKTFDMQFLKVTDDYRLSKKVLYRACTSKGLVNVHDVVLERRHIPCKIVDGETVRDGADIWIDWTNGTPPCAELKPEFQEKDDAHRQQG